MNDKRKHPRINIWVPASLECYDDNGELFNRKLGIILDISLGGMLIETDDVIEANYVEIIFVNHEHELMSIVGSIVHSKKCDNGKTKTGICFHGADSENVKIATNLIRTHYFGNKKSSLQQSTSTDIPTRSTS
jgi:hypothetical protein